MTHAGCWRRRSSSRGTCHTGCTQRELSVQRAPADEDTIWAVVGARALQNVAQVARETDPFVIVCSTVGVNRSKKRHCTFAGRLVIPHMFYTTAGSVAVHASGPLE